MQTNWIAENKDKINLFLENKINEINEGRGFEKEEIDFECACIEGKYKIVEELLSKIKYLSNNKVYLQDQIEFVKEIKPSKGRTKVIEILNNYINR